VHNVILFIGILVRFELDLFWYFEAAADTAKTIGESLTKRDKFMILCEYELCEGGDKFSATVPP
jgi:hypothetical protein